MSSDASVSSGEEEDKDVTEKENILEFEVKPVYLTIVRSTWQYHQLEEIEMMDVEALALDALIKYCYTGKITINDTNVLSILPATCLLQLDEVKDVVCTEEFYQLPVDRLIELISNEELHVRSEEQ
ncbi:hypothetical protein TELCIR_16051, partial [Teladorsagia circumcincta]